MKSIGCIGVRRPIGIGKRSSYWSTRYISALVAVTVSDTEQTITPTIVGAGYDGVSFEYSTFDFATGLWSAYSVKGTANGAYSAMGLTPNVWYKWRARLYKGSNFGEYSDWHCVMTNPPAGINTGTVAWYKSDVQTGITKGATGKIAQQNDVLGSGHDLKQTIHAVRMPVWGFNGTIFDGAVDSNGQFLETDTFEYNQPEFIYLIIKQLAHRDSARLIDGNVYASGLLVQTGVSPTVAFYAGGTWPLTTDKLTLNSWHILRVLFSGASSKLIINAEAPVTGNAGVANMGRITEAAGGGSKAAGCSNIALYERIYRSSGDNESVIYNYLLKRKAELEYRESYIDLAFGCCFCFASSVYYSGYPNGTWNIDLFAPTSFPDFDELFATFKSAGMNYIQLAAKGEDGFCMYPTAFADPGYQPFSVAQTSWYAANGNPDLLGLMITAARTAGLEPILYYSIRDLRHEARTGTDETTDSAAYIAMIKYQLTELLTLYGDIKCIWIDDWNWHVQYADIPYATIYNHIKSIQPNCLVINNEQLHPACNSDIEVKEDGTIAAGNKRPCELIKSIRLDEHWIWLEADDQSADAIMSAATIEAELIDTASKNGTYLLAILPDKGCVLPQAQRDVLVALAT